MEIKEIVVCCGNVMVLKKMGKLSVGKNFGQRLKCCRGQCHFQNSHGQWVPEFFCRNLLSKPKLKFSRWGDLFIKYKTATSPATMTIAHLWGLIVYTSPKKGIHHTSCHFNSNWPPKGEMSSTSASPSSQSELPLAMSFSWLLWCVVCVCGCMRWACMWWPCVCERVCLPRFAPPQTPVHPSSPKLPSSWTAPPPGQPLPLRFVFPLPPSKMFLLFSCCFFCCFSCLCCCCCCFHCFADPLGA